MRFGAYTLSCHLAVICAVVVVSCGQSAPVEGPDNSGGNGGLGGTSADTGTGGGFGGRAGSAANQGGGGGTGSGDIGGSAGQTCACEQAEPRGAFSPLAKSWECTCPRAGDCGSTLVSAIASAKAAVGFDCFEIREYDSCELTLIRRRSDPTSASDSVYDQRTGALVGSQRFTDTPTIACRAADSSWLFSISIQSGRLPDCPMTSCVGTCAPPGGMVNRQPEGPCPL